MSRMSGSVALREWSTARMTTEPLWRMTSRRASTAPGSGGTASLRRWYPADPFTMDWAKRSPELSAAHRERLANALKAEAEGFGAGEAALANVERLRQGAAAVVSGQQVALFGGPLF